MVMKNPGFLTIFLCVLFIVSCDKDDDEVSERFRFLTGSVWASDSLLVNGFDGSFSGGPLEDFKGDAKFSEDGTGTFGSYAGTWKFEQDEAVLVITSPDLPLAVLSAQIAELTAISLKITTVFPDPADFTEQLNIRMTFKAK